MNIFDMVNHPGGCCGFPFFPFLPFGRHVPVPEVSVDERRLFSPALPGVRLQETVVHMDRVGQVQSALLVTWKQTKMKPVPVHGPAPPSGTCYCAATHQVGEGHKKF